MVKERIGALITGTGSIIDISPHRNRILELVEQNRIPAIYASVGFIEDGGLLFYGVNHASTFGGIVRPICFAVVRLLTNWNLVSCAKSGNDPNQSFLNLSKRESTVLRWVCRAETGRQ
jgi:hypothetical protein